MDAEPLSCRTNWAFGTVSRRGKTTFRRVVLLPLGCTSILRTLRFGAVLWVLVTPLTGCFGVGYCSALFLARHANGGGGAVRDIRDAEPVHFC